MTIKANAVLHFDEAYVGVSKVAGIVTFTQEGDVVKVDIDLKNMPTTTANKKVGFHIQLSIGSEIERGASYLSGWLCSCIKRV
jgi:hypothetical protein